MKTPFEELMTRSLSHTQEITLLEKAVLFYATYGDLEAGKQIAAELAEKDRHLDGLRDALAIDDREIERLTQELADMQAVITAAEELVGVWKNIVLHPTLVSQTVKAAMLLCAEQLEAALKRRRGMNAPLFQLATEEIDGWMLCFGRGADGKDYTIVTNGVHASDANLFLRGAKLDAELVLRILNDHYLEYLEKLEAE